MPAADLIDDLASRGQYHFTTDEMAARVGSSVIAARAALRRLQKKGVVATPHRGFHVIVPPEYRRLGCLPADQFIPQLMEHLGLDYYAALLTAGRYHGAAHQQPQVFQWRQTAPWIQDSQVEQDLILSRALVENTYHLDELLGTKLRALYQRKKSRDLFDLWTAHRSAEVDPQRVVSCFLRYLDEGGHRVSRAEFEANLAAKLADGMFTRDIEPLLAPRAAWDIEDAARYVRDELLARLPGDPWKGGEAES